MVFPRRGQTSPQPVAERGGVELSGLIAAARAVNDGGTGGGGLAAVLDQLLDEAVRLVRADEGAILLRTDDGARLTAGAGRGRGHGRRPVSDGDPGVGEELAAEVVASGRPRLVGRDPAATDDAARSALAVPLRARGRVLGALTLTVVHGGQRATDLTAADLDVAALVAELAATAVDRAGGGGGGSRPSGDDPGEPLLRASQALAGTTDVAGVAACVLDAATALVDAWGGFVVALPDDRTGPELAGYRELPRGRVLASMRRLATSDRFRGGGLQVVADVTEEPLLTSLVTGHVRGGALLGPLVTAGAVRGLLVVLTGADGPTDAQLSAFRTYAQHAALALARALLARSVQAKQHELTSLASAVTDPVVIVDDTGRLVAVNPAAGEQLGLSPAFDVGAPISGKLRSAELETLLRADEPGSVEVTLYSPEPRTFRARTTLVRPGHGPVGARILTLEDVTDERAMERLKADFVAVIGHELRTPLTMIKGYAGTLAKRGEEMAPETRSRALTAVNQHANRLERLIEDLLLVSKVERSRPPLHLESLELRAAVGAAVERARELYPDRGIELSSPDEDVRLLLDAIKVERILHQLIDNAIKFSEAPDTVRVEVEALEDGAEVRVVDTGTGIFSGDVPRLFDRFHQVDGSATRAHGGTGIGLYICRTLVEAHGGEIGVRSALGRGSTFWFRLPAEPPDHERVRHVVPEVRLSEGPAAQL